MLVNYWHHENATSNRIVEWFETAPRISATWHPTHIWAIDIRYNQASHTAQRLRVVYFVFRFVFPVATVECRDRVKGNCINLLFWSHLISASRMVLQYPEALCDTTIFNNSKKSTQTDLYKYFCQFRIAINQFGIKNCWMNRDIYFKNQMQWFVYLRNQELTMWRYSICFFLFYLWTLLFTR